MILSSRKYPSPDIFVEEFLKTITPGVIRREDFIQWSALEDKMARLKPFIEFFVNLKESVSLGKDFRQELGDSLLSSDDPFQYIVCAFEIIGQTNTELVTSKDDISAKELSKRILEGDREAALEFAESLKDIGFERALSRDDIEDVIFGVQIGLETHRRKNIGGKAFSSTVRPILSDTISEVSERTGRDVTLSEQKKIHYKSKLSKDVDFAIIVDGDPKFGIELNFYTTIGSKPTEIKRSYGDVRRGLSSVGVDLIWITDGKGYRRMVRSLRDSYTIVPNIYNIKQLIRHLSDDLVIALR